VRRLTRIRKRTHTHINILDGKFSGKESGIGGEKETGAEKNEHRKALNVIALGHLLPEYFFSGRRMDSQDYVHIEKAGEK